MAIVSNQFLLSAFSLVSLLWKKDTRLIFLPEIIKAMIKYPFDTLKTVSVSLPVIVHLSSSRANHVLAGQHGTENTNRTCSRRQCHSCRTIWHSFYSIYKALSSPIYFLFVPKRCWKVVRDRSIGKPGSANFIHGISVFEKAAASWCKAEAFRKVYLSSKFRTTNTQRAWPRCNWKQEWQPGDQKIHQYDTHSQLWTYVHVRVKSRWLGERHG